MDIQSHIKLPLGLFGDVKSFDAYARASALTIEVSSTYLEEPAESELLSEVIAIQRLISLARRAIPMRARWHHRAAERVFGSPSLFPLLAVLLCLDDVAHEIIYEDNSVTAVDVQSSRQLIYKHRLQADLFSDTQILVCADSRGYGRPKSLYSDKSSGLIGRSDFESLVDRLLIGQSAVNVSTSQAVFFSQSIATIVAELFENTDVHGRLGLNGIPFKANGIRGLVFKRVKISQNEKRRSPKVVSPSGRAPSEPENKKEIDALEISVFDAGVGFYSSYTKEDLTQDIALTDEWRVMHQCLERHYDQSMADTRPSHRAMGLYEVLRALKSVHGALEVRSGRTYGFRTFVAGEFKMQLESGESALRPGMPKPVLLDVTRKFVTAPSPHELLVGASVRVVIPLS